MTVSEEVLSGLSMAKSRDRTDISNLPEPVKIDGMTDPNVDSPEHVLSEAEVRTLNRDVLSKLSKDQNPDVERITTLLHDILRTTEEVRLDNTHRASACDALCGLLKHGSSSSHIGFRSLCTSPAIWTRTLAMYFDRYNDARARPLKQILETLIRLLQEMYSSGTTKSQDCVAHAIHKCVDNLSDESNPGFVRPAMFVLDNLLTKKLTSSVDVIKAAARAKGKFQAPASFSESEFLVYIVLSWAKNPDIAPVSGRLLTSLCAGLTALSVPEHDIGGPTHDVWVAPLRSFLDDHPSLIGVLEQDILPGLLRLSTDTSRALLQGLPFRALAHGNTSSATETDIRLCLLLLRINDEIRFTSFDDVVFNFDPIDQNSSTPAGLPASEQICVTMLRHGNPDIRLAALGILTFPKVAARPLSEGVMLRLQDHVWDFFDETDARIRNDYLSLMRRLFVKMEAIALRLGKLETGSVAQNGRHVSKVWPTDNAGDLRKLLLTNVGFLGTYTHQIATELVPTASYQRHILALKTLSYIRKLNIPDSVAEILPKLRPSRWLVRSLLDLLMDPFEDVRSLAAGLLVDLEPDKNLLQIALVNATRLMRASGRADHADGYGRLVEVYQLRKATGFNSVLGRTTPDHHEAIDERSKVYRDSTLELVEEVDQLVVLARANLEKAVSDAPLHGKIIALKYLVSSSQSSSYLLKPSNSCQGEAVEHNIAQRSVKSLALVTNGESALAIRVAQTCGEIWKLVHPILCIDSPEGTNFLAGDEEDAPDMGIKDTLSYAWRALKESSLLLRAMMALAWKGAGIDTPTMQGIGKSLFVQLAQLRHRGAFSAVAQTYAAFCAHCTSSSCPDTRQLLVTLYEDTLACIQEKSTALTRRSAGLPALIVGLLCAKPGKDLTARVLEDLQRIAKTPVGDGVTSELPQVHALNCLKDIFTNTKLGPATDIYLSQMFTIAVDCLDKDLWAIRNSGLMLLKALLVRLEEGRINSNTMYQQSRRGQFSKAAYAKHPALANVVLGLLQKATSHTGAGTSSQEEERLIEKTFPAIEVIERVGIPIEAEGAVKELLLRHLGGTVWAMRSKTAGCLALLLQEDEMVSRCALADQHQLVVPPSYNQLHGNMLLIRHALREGRIRTRREDLAMALLKNSDAYLLHTKSMSVQEIYHENMINLFKSGVKGSPAREYAQLCGLNLAEYQYLGRYEMFFGNRLSTDISAISHAVVYATGLNESLVDVYEVLEFCLSHGNPSFIGALNALRDLERALSAEELQSLLELSSKKMNVLEADTLINLLTYLATTIHRSLGDVSPTVQCNIANKVLELNRMLLRSGTNAAVINALIVLWGVAVGIFYGLDYGGRGDTRALLKEWHSMLRTAMLEETDVDIREAAIDSIAKFVELAAGAIIPDSSLTSMIPILLVIHDGLVDDDEDIRNKSAGCASWALAAIQSAVPRPRSNLSPTAARQELVELFRDSIQESDFLTEQSLVRTIGCDLTSQHTTSFRSKIQNCEDKATILFDEEKQNLFIDDYQESRTWAQIAKRSNRAIHLLGEEQIMWIAEALKFVLMRLESSDNEWSLGPLGTFSRAEIFLLVARLLLYADVLLHVLSTGSGSISTSLQEIKRTLAKLKQVSGNEQRPLYGLSQELYRVLTAAASPHLDPSESEDLPRSEPAQSDSLFASA